MRDPADLSIRPPPIAAPGRTRGRPVSQAREEGWRYNPDMEWQARISVDPAIRGGKPCVKGTRVTVHDVLEYHAGGMNSNEIPADFPDLTRVGIQASPAVAAAR